MTVAIGLASPGFDSSMKGASHVSHGVAGGLGVDDVGFGGGFRAGTGAAEGGEGPRGDVRRAGGGDRVLPIWPAQSVAEGEDRGIQEGEGGGEEGGGGTD